MKAAVVKAPRELIITDVEQPKADEGDVIVKVMACGVCGTDLHIYEGEFIASYPIVMGHEFCGVVVEVGEGVSHISVGERVAIQPNVSCGICEMCKRGRPNLCESMLAYGVHIDGGFAQYCVVRSENVFSIGDMSFEAGAFVEPLACCVNGIKAVDVGFGERVLIFGSGPIGLLLAQLCKLRGAAEVVVVDLVEERLKTASTLGLTALLSSEIEADKAIHTNSYEVVIDATGSANVIEEMPTFTKDGGRILIFGVAPRDAYIRLSPFEVYRRELTITGAFSLGYDFETALNLLMRGLIEIEPLITHRMPLEELERALEYKRQGVGMKTLIFPNE
ncbi:MAG: hypothetical protein RUDDFDWM_000393 [Candidatus Fervidibacterota bacterium]